MIKVPQARRRHVIVSMLLVAATCICITGGLFNRNLKQEKHSGPAACLTCILDAKAYDDTTKGLINGYNYELLRRYADDFPAQKCDIFIAVEGESSIDSLISGAVDIVVLPACDAPQGKEFEISHPTDSMTVWVTMAENGMDTDTWLIENQDSVLQERFFNTFNNPFSVVKYGITRQFLSPYDSLFRAHAPKLGWDWRLLAALAWQESRFHIEARSHRGALGLMQMMPGTADRYEVESLINPEESVRAGVEYLCSLQRMFRRKALDKEELTKFTLAAYNAGQGRIRDCINYAQYKEVYDSTWECIPAILPDMADDAILEVDTVKFGKFKGQETVAFVDNVLSIYEAFKLIAPFSPDQRGK